MNLLTLCVIAIIDTGVNCAGLNCLPGYNNTDDGNGHGTLVAQIAQQTAPDCKILPVKVYDRGTLNKTSLFSIYKGLRFVRNWKNSHPKASVAVNLSLGSKLSLTHVVNEIRRLKKRGVPVIVAAGNGSFNRLAKYKSTIAVGALDSTGNVEPWSSFGDVYVHSQRFNGQAFAKGTSYAAPVVAAILAKVGGR